MRSVLFLAVVVLFAPCIQAADWAVIVAGSRGFSNYRHHADVCHAFHIASDWGIPSNQIITMLYDDIATNPLNPIKGYVFNKPTPLGVEGVNVYEGCQKDYVKDNVTATNFLKVLTGDETAPGPVLQSGPDDNVFINFVDHGASGVVSFPVGNYLYAKDLIGALKTMSSNKMYKKLVLYMEACEAGSMFENLIPDDLGIYVTTASNAEESSYGTYCPPDDEVNGKEVGSCLGDEYSVGWMENSEAVGQHETLNEQFAIVKNATKESHVMRYGDLSFVTDPIGAFQGNLGDQSRATHRHHRRGNDSESTKKSTRVSSRDIELHTAYYRYTRALPRSLESREAYAALTAIVEARQQAEQMMEELVRSVVTDEAASESQFAVASPSSINNCDKCCKAAESAIRVACGGFSDYSMQYMRVIFNLCELGHHSEQATSHIVTSIHNICSVNGYNLGNVLA